MPERYLAAVPGMAGVSLGLFAVVTTLNIELLTDPPPALEAAAIPAALLGVGPAVADVALPVPSSVAVTAHDALFRAVPGTLLSPAASVAAGLVGFGLGRGAGRLLDGLVREGAPGAAPATALGRHARLRRRSSVLPVLRRGRGRRRIAMRAPPNAGVGRGRV